MDWIQVHISKKLMENIVFYIHTYTHVYFYNHSSSMWHDMVHWGQSRHFSELSYNWYCHLVINIRIILVQTPSSYLVWLQSCTLLWCLFSFKFLCFFTHFCLEWNFLFADFGFKGPDHVTYYINVTLSLSVNVQWSWSIVLCMHGCQSSERMH